jgi:hypothetical protein
MNPRRALAIALSVLAAGCSTDAVGVDVCKQIEEARCREAPACGIPLEPPYHTAGDDVGACIRYYDVACLHGLALASDPGTTAVNACVAAIQNDGCAVVAAPESDPACAWLVPAAPPADAAANNEDASTDASTADGDDGADGSSE